MNGIYGLIITLMLFKKVFMKLLFSTVGLLMSFFVYPDDYSWQVENDDSISYKNEKRIPRLAYYGRDLWITNSSNIAFIYDLTPVDNNRCIGINSNEVITINSKDVRVTHYYKKIKKLCITRYSANTDKGKDFFKQAFKDGANVIFPNGVEITLPPAGNLLVNYQQKRKQKKLKYENAL